MGGLSTVIKGGGEMVNIFLLVELLSASGFGAYVFGWTVVTLGSVVTTIGLDKLVAYKIPRLSEKRGKSAEYRLLANTLTYAILASSLIAVLMLLNIQYISSFVSSRSVRWVKALTFILPFLSMRRVLEQWLIAREDLTRRYLIYRITPVATKFTLFSISVIAYGNGLIQDITYEVTILAVYISFVLPVIFHVATIYRTCMSNFNGSIDVKSWKYSISMSMNDILKQYMWRVDILFVTSYVGDTAAGGYKAVVRIAKLSKLVDKLTTPVFKPQIGKLLERQRLSLLSREYNKVRVLSFSFGLLFILAAIICGERALSALGPYGKYTSSLLILSFGYISTTGFGNIGNLLVMDGRSFYVLTGNVIGFIMAVIANFLLVPVLGVSGAALGTCVAVLIQNTYMWLVVKAKIEGNFLNLMEVPIGVFGVCVFSLISINDLLWLYLVPVIFIVSLFYITYQIKLILGTLEKLRNVYFNNYII
jgi:O-antigen/teichoic acid export membrane protein